MTANLSFLTLSKKLEHQSCDSQSEFLILSKKLEHHLSSPVTAGASRSDAWLHLIYDAHVFSHFSGHLVADASQWIAKVMRWGRRKISAREGTLGCFLKTCWVSKTTVPLTTKRPRISAGWITSRSMGDLEALQRKPG